MSFQDSDDDDNDYNRDDDYDPLYELLRRPLASVKKVQALLDKGYRAEWLFTAVSIQTGPTGPDVVRALIKAGANVNDRESGSGYTVLMKAVEKQEMQHRDRQWYGPCWARAPM